MSCLKLTKIGWSITITKKHDSGFYSDLNSFNLSGYKNVLNHLNTIGIFMSQVNENYTNNTFFLRHDVELSLQNSKSMFEIEKELGVFAHYYFRTNSPSYRLGSHEFQQLIQEIKNYGSNIGLHFERIDEKKSYKYEFDKQIDILENYIETEIVHYSPHNPGTIHNLQTSISPKFINAYSYIIDKNFGYISDSNGVWIQSYLSDFLQHMGQKPYQILIHPEWWGAAYSEPLTRVIEIFTQNYSRNLYDQLNELIKTGRISKDEIILFENKLKSIESVLSEVYK
jgi:hypothetical protein